MDPQGALLLLALCNILATHMCMHHHAATGRGCDAYNPNAGRGIFGKDGTRWQVRWFRPACMGYIMLTCMQKQVFIKPAVYVRSCACAHRPDKQQDVLLQHVCKRNAGSTALKHVLGMEDDASSSGSSAWSDDQDCHASSSCPLPPPRVSTTPRQGSTTATNSRPSARQLHNSRIECSFEPTWARSPGRPNVPRPIKDYTRVAVTGRQVRRKSIGGLLFVKGF